MGKIKKYRRVGSRKAVASPADVRTSAYMQGRQLTCKDVSLPPASSGQQRYTIIVGESQVAGGQLPIFKNTYPGTLLDVSSVPALLPVVILYAIWDLLVISADAHQCPSLHFQIYY